MFFFQHLFRKMIVANQSRKLVEEMENYKIPNREIQQYSRQCNVWQFKSSMEWNAGIQNISKGQNSDKIGSFRHEFARHRGLNQSYPIFRE